MTYFLAEHNIFYFMNKYYSWKNNLFILKITRIWVSWSIKICYMGHIWWEAHNNIYKSFRTQGSKASSNVSTCHFFSTWLSPGLPQCHVTMLLLLGLQVSWVQARNNTEMQVFEPTELGEDFRAEFFRSPTMLSFRTAKSRRICNLTRGRNQWTADANKGSKKIRTAPPPTPHAPPSPVYIVWPLDSYHSIPETWNLCFVLSRCFPPCCAHRRRKQETSPETTTVLPRNRLTRRPPHAWRRISVSSHGLIRPQLFGVVVEAKKNKNPRIMWKTSQPTSFPFHSSMDYIPRVFNVTARILR